MVILHTRLHVCFVLWISDFATEMEHRYSIVYGSMQLPVCLDVTRSCDLLVLLEFSQYNIQLI